MNNQNDNNYPQDYFSSSENNDNSSFPFSEEFFKQFFQTENLQNAVEHNPLKNIASIFYDYKIFSVYIWEKIQDNENVLYAKNSFNKLTYEEANKIAKEFKTKNNEIEIVVRLLC